MKPTAPDSPPARGRWRRLAAACAVLGLAALLAAGCGGDADPLATPPPAADGGYRYLPELADLELVRGTWRDFRVLPPAGATPRVRWQRTGEAEAVGERFRYFARGLGREILTARVEAGDGAVWTRRWTVLAVPPGPPVVDFLPAGDALTAFPTVAVGFAVTSAWPLGAVRWFLDGAEAGADSLLAFTATAPGSHTVAVAVQVEDSTSSHAWTVDVRPLAEAAPPAVVGITAAPGTAAGDAVLSWDAPTDSALPLVAFEVRIRGDGPPTETSWAGDTDPGDRPWTTGTGRYRVYLPTAATGLDPGQEAWFAVRARNVLGQLSPLGAAVPLRVPGEWWVDGTVRGPAGAGLPGVAVEDREHRHRTATAADGTYRLGPYFELTRIVLEAGTPPDAPADSAWHYARSDSLAADGSRRHDFLLIPRLGSAPDCFAFGDNFLAYLRTMTRTRVPNPRRPDVRLHRWLEYPVTVHVPAWVSTRGVDYGACVRDAAAIWNESLGETYLEVVDDPAAARITARYDLVDGINYGEVVLDSPGGGELILGDATPEQASLRLSPDLPTTKSCTEIALHEFGHALGLIDHAYCNNVPYVMYVSVLGALDRGREQAIHPDERHAVSLIRLLPDGLDMAAYPLDAP